MEMGKKEIMRVDEDGATKILIINEESEWEAPKNHKFIYN